MTDGSGTSTYQYDSLHRITQSINGAGQAVGYGYDLKGQLTSITYPGNKLVRRTYDDAGRLTAVVDWLNSFTQFWPDADGNVTTEASSGLYSNFSYDDADRLMGVSHNR